MAGLERSVSRTLFEWIMPYRSSADLPSAVRHRLPAHAQDIYREAFNHAFSSHSGDARQEEIAHRIAWAAVKRSYVKVGDDWVAISGTSGPGLRQK